MLTLTLALVGESEKSTGDNLLEPFVPRNGSTVLIEVVLACREDDEVDDEDGVAEVGVLGDLGPEFEEDPDLDLDFFFISDFC